MCVSNFLFLQLPLLFLPIQEQVSGAVSLPWPVEIPSALDWDMWTYEEASSKSTHLLDVTIERIKDSFDDVPSGVSDVYEGYMGLSNDVDTAVSDAYETFHNKSGFMANAAITIYKSMSAEDVNYRFHLILEQETPDFSPLLQVCPNNCTSCMESSARILCHLCCPDLYSRPIALPRVGKGSSFSALVASWMQSILSWTGLHLVYQSWLQPGARQQHDAASQEVRALIRNFNWLQQAMKSESGTLERVDGREEVVDMRTEEICGFFEGGRLRVPQGRVVGGKIVGFTRQYPWQLSLATGYLGLVYQHRCGAALLSTRWVLTAAHCMLSLEGTSFYVMGGFLDIDKQETAQIRKVDKYFAHENFVAKLYEQDVALLRLETPVVYTPSLLPVCLPSPTVYSFSNKGTSYLGDTAILTGWGRQWTNGPLSTQLEMVELPVISNTECMTWYNNSGSRQFIPEDTFMCAGWEEGARDACGGDSGGPLVVARVDGRAEVIGLVSWGIGCGVKGRPGVYTRVSQFVPWIEKTIKENE
eukprot:GFUD01042012.1.p1 GENE.GFUD01042012.1~~GFUD01042012.1.p1  ORF type:complete len:530 (-),score=88.62 GFUD01042012.1:14-1603(-)